MALKKGLLKQAKNDKIFQEHQQSLKEKYHIQSENTVVVEKNNMVKFTVKYIVGLIRIVIWIFLILLAAVGLLCFIHPDMRDILFQVFKGIVHDIKMMV